MARIQANRFWRDMTISFGGARGRVPINGYISADYFTKSFEGSSSNSNTWRAQRSGTTLSATATEMLMEGGMRLQSYWRIEYDLDIGGFSDLAARFGVRRQLNTRVQGLSNIIQTFDVLPGRGRTREFDASFRNVRGDNRSGSMSAWEFDLSHDRSVTYSRDNISISTTTLARLPINFSVSLSAEVSAQIGAEISVEPLGVGGGISASAGSAAGASVELAFRQTLELRLLGTVNLSSNGLRPR